MSSEAINVGRNIFQTSLAVREFLKTLPEGTEIAIRLLDRVECALLLKDNEVVLEERQALNPDVELAFGNEILRKWNDRVPDEISSLALDLVREAAVGQVRFKLLRPPRQLKEKGYLDAVKKLAPKVQGEIMQKGFILLAQAQGLFQTAANMIKERLSK